MIQKLLALLTIYLFFFSNFEYSINSHIKHQNCLLPSNKDNFYENNNTNDNIIYFNNFNLSFSILDYNNSFNTKNIYFKIFNLSYILNFRFNIIQVEYLILFHHENNSLIIPSDLSLNFNLHLICHISKANMNLSIDSLAFISQNKYFKCIEYIKVKEKINFGIIIYESQNLTSCANITQYLFNDEIFNYNRCYGQNDQFFHPYSLRKQFYLKKNNISLSVKSLYIKKPEFKSKTSIIIQKNEWKFINLYNHYFCLCCGNNCLYYNLLNHDNITQICKYKFYLNLIEENKYLYKKTDYLLADFPGDFQSLDDAYPVFRKLIKLKKNAYYMTINKQILENKNITDFSFNHIIKGNMINGDFLENYFTLFLKLKAVISGAEYFSFSNIFYYMDYITFISLTHGLNYFKAYLYKTYYGYMKYNKLVISTSEKLISIATKNGWKQKDLIKICLPKWDKIDKFKKRRLKNNNKSIFFFFTWRSLNEGITEEMVLKSDYFQNIIGLINNKYLVDALNKNGITLYFCIHHMFNIYKEKIVFGSNNIKFIEQNEILNRIIKANMLVTDFSSIIFEFIYQNKPFVMFIPDSEDPTINKLYNWEYIKLIKDLKGGLIDFRNIFFSINQVVNKIKYYINNDFKVEENLNEFYENFNLTCGNNTIKFINYLENL